MSKQADLVIRTWPKDYACWYLFKMGHTYQEIGKIMGCSAENAYLNAKVYAYNNKKGRLKRQSQKWRR